MKSFKFFRGFERESFLPRILRINAGLISRDLIPVVPMDPPRGILNVMNQPLISMSHRYGIVNQENQGQ